MNNVLENVSLKDHHTFSTNAKARWLTTFTSIEECQQLINSQLWQENQQIILGEGSNTLFTDDFTGIVLINKTIGINKLEEKEDFVILKVGGGVNWNELVNYCVENNLCGLENLALIPGSVGAAPIQNIGAYGAELSDVLVKLTAVSACDGSLKTFKKTDCELSYRDSIFKNRLKNKFVICDITIKLSKKINLNLEYGQIKNTLEKMDIKTPTIKDVRDAVIAIRNSKLPNPQEIPNAGSFFKNPIIDVNTFKTLLNKFPGAPHYEVSDKKVKIPAAWLIEQCGWKGKMLDENVGVYEKHALVLINPGKANGNDVLELANHICYDVFEKFQINLEPEINII